MPNPQLSNMRAMQRRPSLRAQHASELSRVGTSTRRAPRWFRGVRAPRVLRDDWTVASACPGTRTRASIEISRARRRRSTSCSDWDRLAPGRGGAGASWGRCIDLTLPRLAKRHVSGSRRDASPRSPAPGVLRDAPLDDTLPVAIWHQLHHSVRRFRCVDAPPPRAPLVF